MSRRPDRARRLRRALPLAALFVLLVVGLLLIGPAGRGGPPLDPGSTAPDGTKALVDVLGELGAAVTVTSEPPGEAATAALLLRDRLDPPARARLDDWVRAGGTLVVADHTSGLAPEIAGPAQVGLVDTTIGRACGLPALAVVARVASAGGVVYETPPGATGCFPRGDGHWLVASPQGAGAVVALGGPGALVNARLGAADNALLAAALLAPGPDARVTVLRPALPGEGDATLTDLIPWRVKLAVAQLGVAFALVVAWRARRLGRPVVEPQPVAVPSSELVVAVANLLQQRRARAQAARLLRENLHRELAERLGLPARTPPPALAQAGAARTGVSAERILEVLTGPHPPDETRLVALAQQVEDLRRLVGVAPGQTMGGEPP